MSRYSLRQTPRKKELFDGMVETPGRRSTRRKSQFPLDVSDGEGDSSTAAETSVTTTSNPRKRLPKFVEHIDESPEPEPVPATNGKHIVPVLNGNHIDPVAPVEEKANGKIARQNGKVIDGWEPGMDPKIDYNPEFDFGGTPGVIALMIGFPLIMWYMWIGATYYDGKLPLPLAEETWQEFGQHLFNLAYTGAFPSLKAWTMYWGMLVFEIACYCLLPGIWAYGRPLAYLGDKQLKYYCSAVPSFYLTNVLAIGLHVTGVMPLYTIMDEFGPMLTVAITSGFLVSLAIYASAHLRGATHRMTGHHVYDFFMGAELNPRLFGLLDIKMFLEVRLPWFMLFLISCGAAARQWENYGYVSGEVCFILMAHWLYANACCKGEELIVSTWDMYYEKLGFMLTFWNMAGVPLSYCHCTIYLADHHPDEYRMNRYLLAALFAAYLFVYWVWDSANSQKNRFRAAARDVMIKRKAFPQVPWQTLENPRTIKTDTGDDILVDGWYGLARKVHYSCDAFFAISWGLICGFKSPFPWFYPVFFCCMIAHRAWRDIQRCRRKYGDAWTQYEKEVPYLFIPYVI